MTFLIWNEAYLLKFLLNYYKIEQVFDLRGEIWVKIEKGHLLAFNVILTNCLKKSLNLTEVKRDLKNNFCPGMVLHAELCTQN